IFSFESIIIRGIVHSGMDFHWCIKSIETLKLTEMADEFQTYFIQTAITVFGNNEFCLAGSWCVLFIIPFINFIIFRTMNKGNNIGILLNRARFTKIGKQRTLAATTGFNRPGKL